MNTQTLADTVMQTPIVQDKRDLSLAAQGILDYLASSLQARQDPTLQAFKQGIKAEGGEGKAVLLGQAELATARQAALFNGLQAHWLDYDDVHAGVRGHPSAVILSALFASIDVNTAENIDNHRFLTAYLIGIEVMARLGNAMNPAHYEQGWHSTTTLGGLAAVCAVCYLHRHHFLASALALAATQSSGLRLMFGTPIKALHAGLAAQAAIQAVEWTKLGLNAERDIFDPQLGFFRVFGGNATSFDLTDWGKDWQIRQLWFKTYPYCSAAAGIADGAKQLRAQLKNLENIEHIELIFHPKADTALRYTAPKNRLEERFCAEYIAANCLLGVPLDIAHFKQNHIAPAVQKLMAKINRTYQASPANPRAVRIKVRLKNQKILQASVDYPQGSPQNPYSLSALQQKLVQAVENEPLAQRLISEVQALTQNGAMNHFMQILSALSDA